MASTEEILAARIKAHDHINLVRRYIRMAITELLLRAEQHDASKFEPLEEEMYATYIPRLSQLQYGSPEYLACVQEMGPGLNHHYHNNRHHPEFFPNGVRDMNLLDVMEMFIDWMAASKRGPGGGIQQSIDVGQKRFGLSDELTSILRHTAKALAPRDVTADPFLHEFKKRIGRELWIKPYGAERSDEMVAFVWVLDVPHDQLTKVEDEAMELMMNIVGNQPSTFMLTVADPEKSAKLRAANDST